MRILVTGVSGLLGLNAALQLRRHHEVIGCYHTHPLAAAGVRTFRCDLAGSDAIHPLLAGVEPHVILHAAGLASVDHCEADPVLARRLNVSAAVSVARLAQTIGARLIHISTDHVFDGTQPMRAETDAVGPMNVYARTKQEAEQQVLAACPEALVVRTNFYGWGTSRRTSLSDWILGGLEESRELRMFDDVFFTPVLVNDLVDRCMALLEAGASGILHVGGAERLSKYGFGVRVARAFGYADPDIVPVSIGTLSLTAVRPRDMSLNSLRADALLGSRAALAEGLTRLQRLRQEGWPREMEEAVSASASEL